MFKLLLPFVLSSLLLGFSACSTNNNPTIQSISVVNKSSLNCGKTYQASSGDTLRRIARICGVPVQQLAQINKLTYPYKLKPNQSVFFNESDKNKTKTNTNTAKVQTYNKPFLAIPKLPTAAKTTPAVFVPHLDQVVAKNTQWTTPIFAKIVKKFNAKDKQLGIEFASKIGQTIYASSDGVVAYVGEKLLAHGKIIIIKHANNFYTSYSNNQQLLVKADDKIYIGKAIAVVGKNNFRLEMRQKSTAVNPANYIKNLP